MPHTTPNVQNYKDLRTHVIPQPIYCKNCHSIYGQKFRSDNSDGTKAYICKNCK